MSEQVTEHVSEIRVTSGVMGQKESSEIPQWWVELAIKERDRLGWTDADLARLFINMKIDDSVPEERVKEHQAAKTRISRFFSDDVEKQIREEDTAALMRKYMRDLPPWSRTYTSADEARAVETMLSLTRRSAADSLTAAVNSGESDVEERLPRQTSDVKPVHADSEGRRRRHRGARTQPKTPRQKQ